MTIKETGKTTREDVVLSGMTDKYYYFVSPESEEQFLIPRRQFPSFNFKSFGLNIKYEFIKS
jgi:hypothetical protein